MLRLRLSGALLVLFATQHWGVVAQLDVVCILVGRSGGCRPDQTVNCL